MNRREFFTVANGAALAAGAVGGFGLSKQLERVRTGPAADPDIAHATLSFAQTGEDLILRQALIDVLHLDKPDYIDIGAWEPIKGSNTYFFYRGGSRGVLVEPNPVQCGKLQAVRAGDTVVNAGIAGVGSPPMADYYFVAGDGQLNTFDSAEVERLKKQDPKAITGTIKMPLLDVNKVLADHFKAAPALFSIDTEGMDLSILKTLDFDKWRAKVFIVETALENAMINPDIVDFMTGKGYVYRGGNFVNTVFMDRALFR